MAGILAWAADVVGGAGASDDEADDARDAASAAMTPEQRLRAAELDARAASMRRAIQDLRLRVPPPHVAQRLPHLHAHSLASSAALALQLNAHSSTKEQAQQREITLQEENAAYEKALSDCRWKIQERQMETDQLQSDLKIDSASIGLTMKDECAERGGRRNTMGLKVQAGGWEERNLREMEVAEHNLKAQLEDALKEQEATQHKVSTTASETAENALLEAESLINLKSKDLEEKKRVLELLDNKVQTLEKEWSVVEEESLKNPTPEKVDSGPGNLNPAAVKLDSVPANQNPAAAELDSVLASLNPAMVEAQAEILITDVHAKEKELERLNHLHRNVCSSANEIRAPRSRFSRGLLSGPEDYCDAKAGRKLYQPGLRTEGQKRLMILRSTIVLYVLLLHIVVFIKISV
ncbi:golgin subfamily A member 5 isoform X1 [Panicum miliaceum]|uniref:Golgin subfamily A member 5 isoform X1 n=1 Tax=Panicum miliaceum TaxID=4540 RepID=A0A3L6QLM0_PANMI|nr:golgin subfamily A member 5 isoform X1 [Panicum miliaceum]